MLSCIIMVSEVLSRVQLNNHNHKWRSHWITYNNNLLLMLWSIYYLLLRSLFVPRKSLLYVRSITKYWVLNNIVKFGFFFIKLSLWKYFIRNSLWKKMFSVKTHWIIPAYNCFFRIHKKWFWVVLLRYSEHLEFTYVKIYLLKHHNIAKKQFWKFSFTTYNIPPKKHYKTQKKFKIQS